MKLRLGVLAGVGIGYLIGSGKGKELVDKAKQQWMPSDRRAATPTTRSDSSSPTWTAPADPSLIEPSTTATPRPASSDPTVGNRVNSPSL